MINRLASGLFFGFVLVVSSAVAHAQTRAQPKPKPRILADDRELSGSLHRKPRKVTGNILKPDHVIDGQASRGLALQFVRIVKGVETPVEGLVFKLNARMDRNQQILMSDARGMVLSQSCAKPSISTTIALDSPLYRITPGTAPYEIMLTVKCGQMQKIVFDETSDAGEAIAIWQMARKAENKLKKEVGLAFWKRKITFTWPGSGDYYVGDHVYLTLGHQWDVVSHEMGHAIYDQAVIGVFGGGQHYIDQCYSEALALSEGWASFYAGWLNVDLSDVDARFEYMVPRRAPIRFENVPSDVCPKSTSEWRVTSFLWDLVDLHDDGETVAKPFTVLWNMTLGMRASSATQLKANLLRKGWDPGSLETIWKLNFPGE